MKKLLVFLVLVSQIAFAYRIDGVVGDNETIGYCDNGAFFRVGFNSGRWFASAVNPNKSANSVSKSEAIREACQE